MCNCTINNNKYLIFTKQQLQSIAIKLVIDTTNLVEKSENVGIQIL